MSIPVWGMLEKSQTDPETIEEAIDRLILAHNESEESHLGSGQSLQSHKASEIIDHIVASIISDKIKDGEVIVPKLGWDRFFIMPEIESADAWNKTNEGTGAAIITSSIGMLRLACGNAVGNKTIIYCRHAEEYVDASFNPFLSVRLDDSSPDGLDVGIAIGSNDPFSAAIEMIGIKYIKADAKTYAFYIYHDGESFQEVKYEIGVDNPYKEVWKIVVDDTAKEIKYYINDVLKETIDYSANPPDIGSIDLFSIGCRNAAAGLTYFLYVSSPIYYQNWS